MIYMAPIRCKLVGLLQSEGKEKPAYILNTYTLLIPKLLKNVSTHMRY